MVTARMSWVRSDVRSVSQAITTNTIAMRWSTPRTGKVAHAKGRFNSIALSRSPIPNSARPRRRTWRRTRLARAAATRQRDGHGSAHGE